MRTAADPGRPPVRPRRGELAAIFAGGFAGAMIRSSLEHSYAALPTHWPWATFAVNLAGAAILGALMAAERRRATRYGRPLIGIGLCGALTTFSTLMLELLKMLEASCYGLAAGYAVASIAGGLAVVYVAGRLAGAGVRA